MSHAADMIRTHPQSASGLDVDALAAAIEACFDCAQTCTACADACLGEDMVAELRHCVRTDLDCAAVCLATGQVLSRRTGHATEVLRGLLETCIALCRACGDECREHASMHEHCRVCADACDRCATACEALLATL